MEFIVSRNRLQRALQHARCAITKGNLDIFMNFVFTFPDNPDECTMTVHASNSNVWISETVPLDKFDRGGAEARPLAVWYSDFMRCIKALDDEPLQFTVGEYQLTVRHSVGSFRLPLDGRVQEFLNWPRPRPDAEAPDGYAIDYEAPGLRSILGRCCFAMAQDELRPVLNGVYMNFTHEYAEYVSSDGHKLVRVRKNPVYCSDTTTPAVLSLIIPSPVVKILLRILPATGDVVFEYQEPLLMDKERVDAHGHREMVKITERSPMACVTIDDTIAISFNPLDGKYPHYWSVIPDHSNYQMTIERRLLVRSIERLTIFSSANDMIKFTFTRDKLRLNAEDYDMSMDAEEKLPCSCAKTDGSSLVSYDELLKIGLQDQSLAQILKALQAEKVVFLLIDSTSAVIIQPVPQPDVEDITMLLMPML